MPHPYVVPDAGLLLLHDVVGSLGEFRAHCQEHKPIGVIVADRSFHVVLGGGLHQFVGVRVQQKFLVNFHLYLVLV